MFIELNMSGDAIGLLTVVSRFARVSKISVTFANMRAINIRYVERKDIDDVGHSIQKSHFLYK